MKFKCEFDVGFRHVPFGVGVFVASGWLVLMAGPVAMRVSCGR
jgi:hypothetical protein